MPLTLEQVDHIADLARLELTDEEKTLYREQLSEILDYVVRLQTLNTRNIPPTSSVLPPRSVLRTDDPGSCLPTDILLSNAPLVERDQFRIPPVFE